jgi:hypothetical protein
VLEVEDENFEDNERTRQRQLYCYSISAKRYALYTLDAQGNPVLRKPRPSGLVRSGQNTGSATSSTRSIPRKRTATGSAPYGNTSCAEL